jgi:aerobic-type carbon monoxide dehydrogenase small subunit (CoxS/CutS family)
MATVGLLSTNPDPSADDIARALDRNVCRCGTYPRIVRAIQDAARRMRGAGAGGRQP